MTQGELPRSTGIPQSTISAIENDSVNLGVGRTQVLARALRCHPAVLTFKDGIFTNLPPHDRTIHLTSLLGCRHSSSVWNRRAASARLPVIENAVNRRRCPQNIR